MSPAALRHMSRPSDQALSWWVQLPPAAFYARAHDRARELRQIQPGFLDRVGAQMMRDEWMFTAHVTHQHRRPI